MATRGWAFYSIIFDAFSATGLILLPFIFLLIQVWSGAVMNARSGDAARTSLSNLETQFLLVAFVFFMAYVPYFDVKPKLLDLANSVQGQCAPEQQGKTVNLPGSQTFEGLKDAALPSGWAAKAPAWWIAIIRLGAGINNRLIHSIDCFTDWQLVEAAVRSARIGDAAIQHEYTRFTKECYARARYAYRHGTPIEGGIKDAGYIGAQFYLDNYYQKHTPLEELSRWEAGKFHRPKNCRTWWLGADGQKGLKQILYEQAAGTAGVKAKARDGSRLSQLLPLRKLPQDDVIKTLLQSNPPSLTYNPALTTSDPAGSGLTAVAFGVAGKDLVGRAADMVVNAYLLKKIVSYAQPILLMLLYMFAAIAILFGGYDFKLLVTYTFIIWGIQALSTVFVLSNYLHSTIMESLFPNGFTLDVAVEKLALYAIFLWLPIIMGGVLLMILTWAGAKSGGAVEKMAGATGPGLGQTASFGQGAGTKAAGTAGRLGGGAWGRISGGGRK